MEWKYDGIFPLPSIQFASLSRGCSAVNHLADVQVLSSGKCEYTNQFISNTGQHEIEKQSMTTYSIKRW